MLPFIIIGLATGAVYGLAAVGLVLTYKTSGVFNFAHGALATTSAYTFYTLHTLDNWSWPVSALISVLGVGLVLGTALELGARRLSGASLPAKVAATVGLLITVESAVILIFGQTQVRTVEPFLPQTGFQLFGVTVTWAQFITFAFAVTVTLALSLVLRFSRRGIAMRAVVSDPNLLDISGTSPVAVRRGAWIIGVTLATASGVLFAPLLPLDPVTLTLLVVSAAGAAAIGGFTSLNLTFAGGLLIGVVASLSTKYFTSGALSNLSPSLPFLVLFLVLLVFPKRRLLRQPAVIPAVSSQWRSPGSLQLTGGALVTVLLVLVPLFAGVHLTDWIVAVATVILFLSLSLLVRTSGQISLAHVSFAAIGAVGLPDFMHWTGLPWGIALLLAAAVAAPIGALLAIPAIRLSGLYLAMATLGFGLLLQYLFYTQNYFFGSTGLAVQVPRPSLSWLDISSDNGFYYLVLAIAVIVVIFIIALERTRLGRLLRALSGSPTALEANGTSLNVTRVLVFCISASLAALSGALVASSQTIITSTSYSPLLSLTYFLVIAVVQGSAPWNAVARSFALTLIPSYLVGGTVAPALQLVFGVSAILMVLFARYTRGTPRLVATAVDAAFRRRGGRAARSAQARGAEGASPARATTLPSVALRVTDVSVRFGGLVALDNISLEALPGRITGLIGPNGAGKTTLFNVCCGTVRSGSGRVSLGDVDISRRSTAARARMGIGRTFQAPALFDELTVRDNVALGMEASRAGLNPLSHFLGSRSQAELVRGAADYALALCGIEELADRTAGELSTGQRRLVELARCLAGPYDILLLDEPSSGLDHVETRRFAEVLRRVVAERGVGILLVEHDMPLVLDVCASLYVLDFGQMIFAGTPDEVIASPAVRAAYLGDSSSDAGREKAI